MVNRYVKNTVMLVMDRYVKNTVMLVMKKVKKMKPSRTLLYSCGWLTFGSYIIIIGAHVELTYTADSTTTLENQLDPKAL